MTDDKIPLRDIALPVRFEMRASQEWIGVVDDWRANQRPVPSRAEAIRRLVDKGIAAE